MLILLRNARRRNQFVISVINVKIDVCTMRSDLHLEWRS